MLNDKNLLVKILKPVINLKKNNIYFLDGIEVHEISVGNGRDEEIYNNFKEKSKGNLIGFLLMDIGEKVFLIDIEMKYINILKKKYKKKKIHNSPT